MTLLSHPSKPRVYGYTVWYDRETKEELEAEKQRLRDLGATEVFFDRVPSRMRLMGGYIACPQDQLDSLARIVGPGDVVLIAEVARLGITCHFACRTLDKLSHADVHLMDVRELYGDEEPPAVWFVTFVEKRLASFRASKLRDRITDMRPWYGLGWKRSNQSKGPRFVPCVKMRRLGTRIVKMRDEQGKRWDYIAAILNAEGLYFRDCSTAFFCEWTEVTVRLFYRARRKNWPPPYRVPVHQHPIAKRLARGKIVLPSDDLPPVNPNAGRKPRQSDVEQLRELAKRSQRMLDAAERKLAESTKTSHQ